MATIDAADYVVWRIGPGANYTQAHYTNWRANFGQALINGSDADAYSAVPEQVTAIMLMPVAGLLLTHLGRRTRRSTTHQA